MSEPAASAPAPLSGGFELREQLRHVERVLAQAQWSAPWQLVGGTLMGGAAPKEHTPKTVSQASYDNDNGASARRRPRGVTLSARIAVVGGAAALVSGILMLCIGAVTGRSAMQSVGLPITLLGQVALLLGMVVQLDLGWTKRRLTVFKLDRVRKYLSDLESLTDELETEPDEQPSEGDEREVLSDLRARLESLSRRLTAMGR